jgi:hypothetical protein
MLMCRGLLYFVCAFFACALVPNEASAGIPIPCTGEHLVLVRQLPDDVKIQTHRGLVHINLGYKFSGCTDGKWVGYSGTGRTYYDLPEAVLELYVIRAGLRGLPREPSYLFTLSASWSAWLWAGMLGFGAVGALGRSKAAGPKAPGEATQPSEAVNEAAPAQVTSAAMLRASAPRDRPTFGRRV